MAGTETHRWIDWNRDTSRQSPEIADAVERFEPLANDAGRDAARWLREQGTSPECRVRVLIDGEVVIGFHALVMGEVELSGRHRKTIGVSHPRQGAVLLAWIARSAASPAGTGEIIFLDALDRAKKAAEYAGAAIFALDPYDDETERYWLANYPLRKSQTETRHGSRRLWLPIV